MGKKGWLSGIICLALMLTLLPSISGTAGAKGATPFYVGNAMHFADGNDSLSSPYLTNQLNSITMEAWVKADTLPASSGDTNIRVMYNGDSASTGYGIYIQNNKPCVLMGNVGFAVVSDVLLTTSKWYHLAAVRNSGAWTLYVNGTAYTPSNSTFVPNALEGIDTFTVGNSNVANENFTGSIDEVRFWTVARTEQQIKDNMYVKLSGGETGLLAYYNFEQGTAGGDNHTITTVTDVAGGDHDLTISGFALNGDTSNFVPSLNLGTFALGRSAYYVREGVDSVTLPIVRTGGSEGSVTINYRTADGTATAGTNYTQTGGSVTFAEGETEKNVTVPIRNSSITTQKEFTFTITGQSGVSITSPSATVTIAPNESILLGTAGIESPVAGPSTAYNYVWFGNNTTPIKWRVLDADNGNAVVGTDSLSDGTNTVLNSGAMFLLMEELYGNLKSSYAPNLPRGAAAMRSYPNSDLYTATTAMTADTSYFTSSEQASMLQTSMDDAVYYVRETEGDVTNSLNTSKILEDDKLFPLSLKEADSDAYFPNGKSDRIAECDSTAGVWRLRSRSNGGTFAAKVNESGIFENSLGTVTGGDCAVAYYMRPAFNLNKSNVLFSSAAEGGKSAVGMDSALTAVATSSPTEWKLTLLDAARAFAVFAPTPAVNTAGGSMYIEYSGAKVGTAEAPEYLSAMLVDSSDNVLYYGRLKSIAAEADASGTLSVTIPAGLPTGDYTLKVFNEQYNGDKKTDYSSAFANVEFAVSAAPTVTAVTVSPATANVVKGGTQQFSASVEGENSPSMTVTWSVEGGIADTTIVGGKLTVAASETAATLTVKATSALDTTKSGTATVTVKTPKPTVTTATSYDVTNAGAKQELKLNVAGINGHSDISWTIAETTDTNNILTLPTTVTGTLSDGADRSLGSITVAANEVGQPAKSATVTVNFFGGADYTSLPNPLTVTFNLAKGAAPAAPTLELDYGSETITGLASGMEYVADTSATADHWSGATAISSSGALDISEHIAENGATANYIHIRVKAVGKGDPGVSADIALPARPAATAFAIDYAAERTTTEVPATVEYNTVSAAHGGTWSRGAGEALALSPGVSAVKTYYFRKAATESSFAGAVQTLAVSQKPPMPTGANITAVSEAGTAGLTTKLKFTIISGSGYEYAIVADRENLTSDTVWHDITGGTEIDNIAGRAATDDVFVRVKAGDHSFQSEAYQILDALTISKRIYSGEQAGTPTLSGKTDATVVLNAVTVAGQTVEYAKNTTNSAPSTGWQEGTTFEGLAPGTHYCFFARVKENADHYAGTPAASESVTTKTAAAAFTGTITPELTASAVTLPYDALWEYRYKLTSAADFGAWQSGEGKNVFADLAAATSYTFHIRVMETAAAMPSETKQAVLYTLPATPAAPVRSGRTATGITLTTVSGCEYSKDGATWYADAEFTGLESATSYTFYQRIKAADGAPASAASDPVTIYTLPATPDVVAPRYITVTADSVTIAGGEGGNMTANQYLVTLAAVETLTGNETWITGTGTDLAVGSALTPATRYKVWVRVQAADGVPASEAAASEAFYTAYATPAAADFTVTQPTAASGEASKGSIVPATGKTASDYEYRIKTGDTWGDWTNLETTPLTAMDAPATIELRVKATDLVPASATYTITINNYASPGSGGTSPVIVDGEEYNIGRAGTSGGVTTVTVDQTKLKKQLDVAVDNVVIPIATDKKADTATARLVVANVDKMAEKGMTLSVQADNVSYDFSAVAVDTASLLKALGATDPAMVPVNVTIKKLAEDDVELEDGELVLPPVEFTVTASYGGKNVEVDAFKKYVRRVIGVPDSVDAGRITTAVVVENGKQRHVPTEVFENEGKWYARINSLTNSTYALIFNEVRFTDDDGKWFEAVAAEMASRGILNGRDTGVFDGEANITRAEFAAILVRALGLPADGVCGFNDVTEGAWYYGAVGTAVEYGLAKGYDDGSFKPDAGITRQEAMAMVHRAASVTGFEGTGGTLDAFSDADSVSAWALADAQWNVGSGLIQGSNGEINGRNNISRGETATIVLRLLQSSGLVDVRVKA